MNPQHQQKRKIRQSCRRNAVPNRFSSRFSTSRTNAPRLLSQPKAGTHSPSPTGSHTRAYTAKQGCFGWGRYYYPRSVPHVSETLRGRGLKRQTLPLLGLGRRRSEERRKPSEQRCAYARRCSEGVAAPLGCVIFLQFGDVAVFSLCAQYFLNVRGRGVLLPSACFACCRNAGRPLVKMVYLPFSGVAEHHSLRGHFFC